jgi:hypothetical protein
LLPLILLAACTGKSEPVTLDPEPTATPAPENTPVTAPIDTDDTTVPFRDTQGDPELFARLVEPNWLHPEGEDRDLRGRVGSSTYALTELTFDLHSDVDGPLVMPAVEDDGRFVFNTAALSPGVHQVTLTVRDPDGVERVSTVQVEICTWPPTETFDTDVVGNGWTTFGDAHWDPGGWLEITGNAQSRAGSIYRTNNKVNPGDFKIEFRIATGGGINSGADGFSVNIVDVLDVAALTTYVDEAANGGCLGYGNSPGCAPGSTPVTAFHIEIDTWYNDESFIQDPTTLNHIAINLDGDPGTHPLWVAEPNLEDLVWRHVVVEAVGQRITLDLDGVRVIDSVLPNFNFDGGYVGVSGSTGWASNFHRFDDLRVYDRCTVP